MEYLFILGRAGGLCRAELEQVLEREKINFRKIFSSPELLHLETPEPLPAENLIKVLGGTVKIARALDKVLTDNLQEITDKIVNLIKSDPGENDHKIIFGLSGYEDVHSNDLYHWSGLVKDRLEETFATVRFILPKEGASLSSVVVKKQKVLEIILYSSNGVKSLCRTAVLADTRTITMAKTLTVQDFEDWGKRDFGRPCSDSHSGMLPPKVARMMVNLGLPIQDRASAVTILDRNKLTVLDPFCGVGTILAEGMAMGYEVIGTDISEAAVQKSQKNLEWLKTNYQSPMTNFQLFQCDATHVSEKLPAGSVDAIVTESYLGPSNIMPNSVQYPSRHSGDSALAGDSRIKDGFWTSSSTALSSLPKGQNDEKRKLNNIITGLDKLYIGCLRDWWKILKPEGKIVMALPSFKIGSQEFFVKKAIDTCENLGYTLIAGPYQYSRPQAVVIRNIYVLKKN